MRPTLVLLPGLLCDEALFSPQIAVLRERADIVVFDHTRHDSMDGLVAAVLAEAPPRFALAGLSLGGWLGMAVALAAPARVARLALLDSRPIADAPESRALRLELVMLAQSGKFSAAVERLVPLMVRPDHAGEDEAGGIYRAMAHRAGPAVFVRQQSALLGRRDLTPELAGIACPTLIVAGRQDMLAPPSQQEEMASLIPHADLALLADCGHLATLERPAAVTAALAAWLG